MERVNKGIAVSVRLLFLILLNYFMLSSAFAWKMPTPIIALGGGFAASSNLGQTQNFPINNPNTDEFYNYSYQNNTQLKPLLDIFAGGEWLLQNSWLMQLGLDVNQMQTWEAKGNLVQGVDQASADQYAFNYSLQSRQLLAESKFLYHYKNIFYPYFLLGLGLAFNKAYSYSTTIPAFTTFTRQYNNNTQTAFSYRIGLGMDTALNAQWRIGVGYRFTDLGKVSLGPATINTTSVSGTLSQHHFYLHEVLAQLTWVI